MSANPNVTRWLDYVRVGVLTYPSNTVPDMLMQMDMESGGDPEAHSAANAWGLYQFIPSTGAGYGLATQADLTNARLSCLAAAHFMSDLRKQFAGHPNVFELALAGYNAGPQAVIDAGYQVPNIPQTKAYVAAITAGVRDYSSYTLWSLAPNMPEVHPWDEGPLVATMQRLVGVAADGRYGPQTQKAVVALKHKYHLPPNPTVGAGLWAHLLTPGA